MKPDLSLISPRPPVATEPRRKLRDWEIAQLMHDQRGFCKACGSRLYAGAFDADHIIPLACGGTNALTNFQLLCRPCHAEKTDGKDKSDAARIKRRRGETGQRARREANGPQIKGRGFPKDATRKFNGEVVRKP